MRLVDAVYSACKESICRSLYITVEAVAGSSLPGLLCKIQPDVTQPDSLHTFQDLISFCHCVSKTSDIVKQCTGMGGEPNMPAAEWKMIWTLLG